VGPRPGASERRAFTVTAERGGEANAIVRWIRLELDEATRLEARPEPGASFFSGLTIAPLPASLAMREGETLTLGAYHDGRRVDTWVEPAG
jgi:hypothetical protein